MTNDKHISIDRAQYDLQTAELCELRAKMAMLYDETPIDAAWVEACGGSNNGHGTYGFGGWDWVEQKSIGEWKVGGGAGRIFVRTRGEFLRAAELLGIQLKEV